MKPTCSRFQASSLGLLPLRSPISPSFTDDRWCSTPFITANWPNILMVLPVIVLLCHQIKFAILMVYAF